MILPTSPELRVCPQCGWRRRLPARLPKSMLQTLPPQVVVAVVQPGTWPSAWFRTCPQCGGTDVTRQVERLAQPAAAEGPLALARAMISHVADAMTPMVTADEVQRDHARRNASKT